MNDFDIAKRKQEAKQNLDNLQGLPEHELRKVLDYLYDGYTPVASSLLQIRGFYHTKKNLFREHQVYLWLARNKLRGVKLVEFIENEGGIAASILKISNSIDKTHKKTLNKNEAL